MELAIDFVKLAVVGTASGFFVSLMANRDFRRQRWWERHVDAYARLIESLSDMLDYYGELCDAEIEHRELPLEHETEMKSRWRQGQKQVRRAANVGAFHFSAEADEALREFASAGKARQDSHWEYLDHHYGAVKKCLESIVRASKRDLQVPSWHI